MTKDESEPLENDSEKSSDSAKHSYGWFSTIVSQLPKKELTGAQVFNLISEALFVLAFIFLLSRVEDWVALLGFFGVMVFAIWCHSATRKWN